MGKGMFVCVFVCVFVCLCVSVCVCVCVCVAQWPWPTGALRASSLSMPLTCFFYNLIDRLFYVHADL